MIEHTADIGIRIFGKTSTEIFRHGAEALFDIICGISNIKPRECGGRIEVRAEDSSELMVVWLGRLLTKFETDRFLASRFEIETLDENFLSSKIYGEKFDPDRHELLIEIKGVTYHGLKMERQEGMWVAEVILDV